MRKLRSHTHRRVDESSGGLAPPRGGADEEGSRGSGELLHSPLSTSTSHLPPPTSHLSLPTSHLHLPPPLLTQVRHCAATMVQAHERRRRAKAETAARQVHERLNDVQKLADLQMQAATTAVETERIGAKFRGTTMTVRLEDGVERTLKDALGLMINSRLARSERERGGAAAAVASADIKFARELVLGRPESAALGIVSVLKIDLFDLFSRCTLGLTAIREEWEKVRATLCVRVIVRACCLRACMCARVEAAFSPCSPLLSTSLAPSRAVRHTLGHRVHALRARRESWLQQQGEQAS